MSDIVPKGYGGKYVGGAVSGVTKGVGDTVSGVTGGTSIDFSLIQEASQLNSTCIGVGEGLGNFGKGDVVGGLSSTVGGVSVP